MNAITSLYIHKVEKHINAEFIAHVFDKNGIAKVSRILLEPHKNNKKYNKAYIEIKKWCDTESACNFIKRLKDLYSETRLVYYEDYWWIVEIGEDTEGLFVVPGNYNILTIFKNSCSHDTDNEEDDIITTDAVIVPQQYNVNYNDNINYEKTRQLKAFINGYKDVDEMDDANNLDGYLHEAYERINNWKYDEQQVDLYI